MENYVFVELCRQGLVPNLSLFGYQTESQYEVDFYIPPITGEAKLVQVCFSTSDIETRQREIRALISAAKELNVKKLYLLSCDESEQRFVQDGFEIDVLPASKKRMRLRKKTCSHRAFMNRIMHLNCYKVVEKSNF